MSRDATPAASPDSSEATAGDGSGRTRWASSSTVTWATPGVAPRVRAASATYNINKVVTSNARSSSSPRSVRCTTVGPDSSSATWRLSAAARRSARRGVVSTSNRVPSDARMLSSISPR